MQRNWDLIRQIMLSVEAASTHDKPLLPSEFQVDSFAALAYQVEILIEAGLVRGEMSPYIDNNSPLFEIDRLTWKGHEFLDSIRSQSVWEKTKKTFVDKGIDMTVDLVLKVAPGIALKMLAGPE